MISVPIKSGGTIELYLRKDGSVDLYAGRRLGPPIHDDAIQPTLEELGHLRNAIDNIIWSTTEARDVPVKRTVTRTTEQPVGAWRKCQLSFKVPQDAAVIGHELNASEGGSILSGTILESVHPVLRAGQDYLIRIANGNTEQRVGLTLKLLEAPK